MFYTFKLYFSIKDRNKRRTKHIALKAATLYEAWTRALDLAVYLTEDDEILNSIQLLERTSDDR